MKSKSQLKRLAIQRGEVKPEITYEYDEDTNCIIIFVDKVSVVD